MGLRSASTLVLVVTTSVVVVGCPGSLDDPQRFQAAGLESCDVRVTQIFATICSVSGCHSSTDPAQGLDLQSPGVPSRLVGVAPTGSGCSGVLVDPKNPTASLLYEKLTNAPPCGIPMPFGGKPLSSHDLSCVAAWITGLGAGDGGGSDASVADGSPPPVEASLPDAPSTFDVAAPVDARDSAAPPEAAPPTGGGLKGEYFDNVDYTSLKLTRTDATVDFLWSATQSPDPAITADGIYSVKWSGTVTPQYGETYTFYADSDDGVRLTVGGNQLFDDQTGHATMEFSGTMTLEAGKSYPLELDWFNSQGVGEIHLAWSSASQARQIIPKDRLTPAP